MKDLWKILSYPCESINWINFHFRSYQDLEDWVEPIGYSYTKWTITQASRDWMSRFYIPNHSSWDTLLVWNESPMLLLSSTGDVQQ